MILNESCKFGVCYGALDAVGSINERNTATAAPMNPPFKVQPNPFRFLLYTEWVMLASCGSFAVLEALEERHLPVQHVLILVLLGLMGLMLPSGKRLYKVLYTGLEIGLIFYGATLGYLHILPALYIIVVIRSCFLFELPGRWAIAGLVFLLFLVHQVRYVQSITRLVPLVDQQGFWMHLVAETLMFGLGLFFVLLLVNSLLTERRTREQLSVAHEQLRQYAFQAEDLAAVQERNRIARDIHDSLGHALTALNVQLQTALKLWQRDPAEAEPFLARVQRLGATAMNEVRRSVSALRADTRQDQPLEEAIDALVEDFRQGTGISTSASISLSVPVPPQVVKTLHRIVQEALTNILKHAQATAVEIQVSTTPDNVRLSIEDNGKGFRLDQQNMTGFGLQGMRERVAALSGDLQLKTDPGTGCRITIELPL